MNRKKYIALTLMLSLLCVNKAYAACTQEDINNFKKIEDEFKITYKFNKETKDYKIVIYNPNYQGYGYSLDSKLPIENISSTTEGLSIDKVKTGEYTFEVLSNSATCKDVLKTIKVNLPKYNKYSEDPLCKDIEEFVLCQPTYDKEIDYETFVSRVNTYKRTKKEQEEKQVETNKENNMLENIMEYLENNLLQIVIMSVFVILMVITIILTTKSIKKSRRLE